MIFNHPFHFPFEGSVIVSLVPSLTCGAANEDNKDFNLHSRNRIDSLTRHGALQTLLVFTKLMQNTVCREIY